MPLRTPLIQYGTTTLFTNEFPETLREVPSSERQSHTAASGRTLHYYVGPRDFIERSFAWQSDSQKTEWESWWNAVKDGTEFWYSEDSNMPLCGDADIVCGGGYKCGTHKTGGTAITTTCVTVDMDDFPIGWGAADTTWALAIRLREYV